MRFVSSFSILALTLVLAHAPIAAAAGPASSAPEAAASEPTGPSAPEPPSTNAEPAGPSDGLEPLDEAASLFYDAEAKYAAGDVRGALEAMQRSYELSRRPELLFNLGELHRELGHCHAARSSYSRYLAEVGDARFRERARAALATLARGCDEHAAAPVLEIAPREATSPRYWTGSRVVGWSLIGAGLAAGACSAYFAVHAKNIETELEETIARNQSLPPAERRPWDEIGHDHYANGQRAATFAYAFGAGAVAVLASGLGILWLGAKDEPSQRSDALSGSAVSIVVSPALVGSAVSVPF